MNFTRAGQWHELSECGRYTVAASKVDGKFMFQAWKRGDFAKLLHTDTDAGACRTACERDAETETATHRAEGEGR